MMRRLVLILAIGICASACSKSSPSPAPPAQAPAGAPDPSKGGRLVGRAPQPVPGASVIVILEPKTAREFPTQTEKPAMDQISQTFTPPILFVRTGQPVEFRNSDDTLHNINVRDESTSDQAFNVAIPTGEIYAYTFKRDGIYHVGCDIHPAMSAEIVSTSTPYATIAETDGTYVLEDVTPDDYRLTVYAGGRKIERDVEVKAGETVVVK